ncbi:MAG: hypothetical protein U0452_12375 [Anaerolineae bacterium]
MPLASTNTPEAMVSVILECTGITSTGECAGSQKLTVGELAERVQLLVLDNMEQLVSDLGLIEALLQGASGVRLLVTSRQPLALDWEWYYPLEGMAVPPSGTDNLSTAACNCSLNGRGARASFRLSDDPQGVARICQRVRGMPLGIELAASWVQ